MTRMECPIAPYALQHSLSVPENRRAEQSGTAELPIAESGGQSVPFEQRFSNRTKRCGQIIVETSLSGRQNTCR